MGMDPIYEKSADGNLYEVTTLLVEDAGAVYRLERLYEKAADGNLYLVHTSQAMYYVNNIERSLYQIDRATGVGQRVGAVGSLPDKRFVTGVWHKGVLYFTANTGRSHQGTSRLSLYRVNRSTGVAIQVVEYTNNYWGGSLGSDGETLYLMHNLSRNYNHWAVNLYTVDVGSGDRTIVSGIESRARVSYFNLVWDGAQFLVSVGALVRNYDRGALFPMSTDGTFGRAIVGYRRADRSGTLPPAYINAYDREAYYYLRSNGEFSRYAADDLAGAPTLIADVGDDYRYGGLVWVG